MKAQTLLVAVLVFIASATFAAEKNKSKEIVSTANAMTSISGTITDDLTGESLAGVKVVLKETNQVAYTDFDGMFAFEGVLQGEYTVTADFISYDEKATAVNTQEDNSLAIKLELAK